MRNYAIIEDKIMLLNPETKCFDEFLCQPVGINKIITDIITQKKLIRISGEIRGQTFETTLPRSCLTRKGIVEALLLYGIQINEAKAAVLLDVLFETESEAPEAFCHSILGWQFEDDAPVYLAHNIIGDGLPSQYVGQQNLSPMGFYSAWVDMVENSVVGHAPLELALTIGFSAMVVGLLHQYIGFTNLLFTFANRTSVGKTTALKLIASIYGKPVIASDGVMQNFDGTVNALINQLCDKLGFPCLLDEATVRGNNVDHSEFIYRVESGVEKSRLNKDCSLRERRTWSTTIVMTTENPLLTKSSNGGLFVRLFELDLQFTESANHSNAIQRCVEENFGHAVQPFAEYLIGLGKASIIRLYHECQTNLLRKVSRQTALSARIMEKLAVVSMTAILMNRVFEFSIDNEQIDSLLIKIHDKTIKKQDEAIIAYEYIKQCILENDKSFLKQVQGGCEYLPGDNKEKGSQNIFGQIIYDRDINAVEIWIHTKILDKFLTSGHFQHIEKIKKKWQVMGLLISCEAGRLSCKKTINGIRPRVYVLVFDREDEIAMQPARKRSIKREPEGSFFGTLFDDE